jgi:hypothetical protein
VLILVLGPQYVLNFWARLATRLILTLGVFEMSNCAPSGTICISMHVLNNSAFVFSDSECDEADAPYVVDRQQVEELFDPRVTQYLELIDG